MDETFIIVSRVLKSCCSQPVAVSKDSDMALLMKNQQTAVAVTNRDGLSRSSFIRSLKRTCRRSHISGRPRDMTFVLKMLGQLAGPV
jgi:hypothetical protein